MQTHSEHDEDSDERVCLDEHELRHGGGAAAVRGTGHGGGGWAGLELGSWNVSRDGGAF